MTVRRTAVAIILLSLLADEAEPFMSPTRREHRQAKTVEPLCMNGNDRFNLQSKPSMPFSLVCGGQRRQSHQQRNQQTRLFMFGNLFGGGKETPERGELALYSKLPASKFDLLTEFLSLWSTSFENQEDNPMGLTTPIALTVEPPSEDSSSLSVKFQFQATKTGKAYDRQKEAEKEDSSKKKKSSSSEKLASEGGVEILVEKVEGDMMKVRARRFDIEEGTIIKEMSEQTILNELDIAMKTWKQNNKA